MSSEDGAPLQSRNVCFISETSILLQTHHAYTENLNSEMSGDSKSAFLHCGYILGLNAEATKSIANDQDTSTHSGV